MEGAKKYDLEVTSLLEVLVAVSHWRDLLKENRSTFNPSDPDKLISIFLNQSDSRCQRHEKKYDAAANAWIKARSTISKVRHLGCYEETSVIDLYDINRKYTTALSTVLYAMHEPQQHREKYNSEYIAIAFETEQDYFGTQLELTTSKFIAKYTNLYNKLTEFQSSH
ncbi:MAG: hypothetical protein JKY50_03725 [Oleispira sp.]|nr:hypothetical protein [Oleispira sp.]